MTTEVVKEEPVTREYGFTVMVKQDGKIEITPHNLTNDFEFVGLVEYVNHKKSDILSVLSQSISVKTLHSLATLAKAVLSSAEQTPQGSEKPAG